MLRESLKEALGAALRYSGAEALHRSVLGRERVTIISYHEPSPGTFASHAAFLARRFNFLSLGALVGAVESGNWNDIPPRSLVVTIDDGHRETFSLLETIRSFNIRPTIFLCSQIVNTSRHFWWKASPVSLPSRGVTWQDFLDDLQRHSGYRPDREYPDRQSLSREEVLSMAPYVDFGSHSRYHPWLTACDDKTCMDEIMKSKEELEEMLGAPVEHFAYPGGAFGKREVEFVRRSGYRSARSCRVGWNSPGTDPYVLRVTGVQDDASLNVLCGQFTGFFPLIKAAKEGLRKA